VRIIRFFPLILYYGLIFYLSSQSPGKPIPFPFADKIIHFILYIPLGVAGGFAFHGIRREKIILICLLFAILGIADELHQSFVPMRKAEILDAIMDFAGSMTGFLVYYFRNDSNK